MRYLFILLATNRFCPCPWVCSVLAGCTAIPSFFFPAMDLMGLPSLPVGLCCHIRCGGIPSGTGTLQPWPPITNIKHTNSETRNSLSLQSSDQANLQCWAMLLWQSKADVQAALSARPSAGQTLPGWHPVAWHSPLAPILVYKPPSEGDYLYLILAVPLDDCL